MADGSVNKDKGVSKWFWWIPALLVVFGLVTAMIGVSTSKRAAISTGTTNKAYEYEYKLSAGQKIYTQVGIGPGVILKLWANQPFSVVASQLENGSVKVIEYTLPAGESGCLGNEPSGVFTIKGISDGTLVKISRQ